MTDVSTVDPSDATTISRIVAAAPELTQSTRATLAALLRSGGAR